MGAASNEGHLHLLDLEAVDDRPSVTKHLLAINDHRLTLTDMQYQCLWPQIRFQFSRVFQSKG
jgi:hypothetical protein